MATQAAPALWVRGGSTADCIHWTRAVVSTPAPEAPRRHSVRRPAVRVLTFVEHAPKAPLVTKPTPAYLLDLLRRVRANDPNLQRIDIGRRLPPRYTVALLLALRHNRHVRRLRLTRCTDTKAAAIMECALALCLRSNRSLDSVSVAKNGLQGRHLAAALERNQRSRVRRLTLDGNPLSDDGVDAVCRALQAKPFDELRLRRTSLGEGGLRALTTLVRGEAVPRVLDLKDNRLGALRGWLDFCAALSNSKVVSLNLSGNALTDGHGTCLAEALPQNESLQHLDLQCNPLSDTTATALAATLSQSNDCLRKCKLARTNVSSAIHRELIDLLEINSFGPDLARQTKLALERIYADTSGGTADHECVICCESLPPATFLPCQHICCVDCSRRLKDCHLCRSTIVKIVPKIRVVVKS